MKRRLFPVVWIVIATATLSGCGKSVGVEEPVEKDTDDPPAELQSVSGEGQSGLVGRILPEPLVVRVVTQSGEPASGIPVSWSVTAGDGSIEALEANTDREGMARAEWTLGSAKGPNSVRAEALNLDPIDFTATGLEESLTVSCQPDTPAIPQNASGTSICTVTSGMAPNDPISLNISSTPDGITAEIHPREPDPVVSETATFLVGISVSGATLAGSYTVSLMATSGDQGGTAMLPFEVEFSLPVVNMVYLVPADQTMRSDYRNAIELAARHLQIWYDEHMRNGKTFTLANPAVSVYHTEHNTEWYATNPLTMDESLWFWNNVVRDGSSLTGGTFNDPENIWIYYIEADPECGQLGGAGTSGIAVLPANDLRGLVGEQVVRPCFGDALDSRPPCGWVGGLGHELGHALGLPHPPGCDEGEPDCDSPALMWLGFRDYPDTYLREDEIQFLNGTPFFSGVSIPVESFSCNEFGALGIAQ